MMGARSSRFFFPIALLFVTAGLPGRVVAATNEDEEQKKQQQALVERCASASETGQRARQTENLLDARDDFRACSVADCPSLIRADCTGWITDLQRETPSIILRARDSRDHDVIAVRVY